MDAAGKIMPAFEDTASFLVIGKTKIKQMK